MALYAKDFQITCNYIEIVKCPVKSVADHRSKNKPPSPLHYTVGPNVKKPAKNKIQKIVKLTGYTYVSNTLTNFEYLVHAMNGNGSYLDLQILHGKSRETTLSELYFRRVSDFWNLCASTAKQACALELRQTSS